MRIERRRVQTVMLVLGMCLAVLSGSGAAAPQAQSPDAGVYDPGWNQFANPTGIVVDGAGRIYIADSGNNRIIRMDDMTAAGWTTLGHRGTGVKEFCYPNGIAIDKAGRIYVADECNHRIVRMDDMTGAGWTVLGSRGIGVGQFFGPQSVVLDGAGRIYVADAGNNRIVRVDDMTGAGWAVLGSRGTGVAQFSNLRGIFVDEVGQIYAADSDNRRVVQMSDMRGAGWTVLSGLGAGVNQFYGPTGVFVRAGMIYVVDKGSLLVRVNDMTGAGWTVLNRWGNGGGLYGALVPGGLFVDGTGRIYVSDTHNRILRVDDMTGAGWFAAPPLALSSAPGIDQGSAAASCPSMTFHGTIGAFPIWIRFCVHERLIVGTYFYERRAEDLPLVGGFEDDGNVVVSEIAEEAHTGIFRQTGVFRGRMRGGHPVLDRWSSPSGHAPLPVWLRAVSDGRGGHRAAPIVKPLVLCMLSFQPHPQEGLSTPAPMRIDVQLPMLSLRGDPYSEAKFNSFIRRWATDHAPRCTTGPQDTVLPSIPPTVSHDQSAIRYSLQFANADLVVVWIDVFQQGANNPHGTESVVSLNYDVAGARFLRLEELFLPASDFVQRISAYCIEHLWRDWSTEPGATDRTLDRDWLESGAGPDPANFKAFAVTPTGLSITFQSSQVAPEVRGKPRVFIPWDALQPVLRPAGIVDAVRTRTP